MSDLSDEECMAFLENAGINIPATHDVGISWTTFVRYVIKKVEENPEATFCFGNLEANDLAYQIKDLVNEYYGVSGGIALATAYVVEELQDNTISGNPLLDYSKYNCMGFAIDNHSWWIPGKIAWSKSDKNAPFSYDWTLDVRDVADLVKSDLEALEYTVYEPTTIMPDIQVADHSHLICVRIDTNGQYYYGFNDFHFMKLDEDGYWYHKPSDTCPLKYKYTPVSGDWWYLEYYDREQNLFVRDEAWSYDSVIYFIEYTTPHSYEYITNTLNSHRKKCTICDSITQSQACTYSYTGNGTHEASCIYCDNSWILPCEMTYEYLMYNQHRAECTLCGDVIAEDCVAIPTYCGNGSTHHIHANACRDCGNAMSSATESCTLEYVFAGTVNGVNTHSRVCAECDYVHTASASCVYRLGDYCFFCGTHRDTQQVASLDDPNTKE